MRSLAVHEHKLYFTYQDTDGQRQTLVYDILEKFWKHYQFGRAAEALHGDDEDDLLIGSLNLGTTYTHTGTSDAGLPIASRMRTGSVSGGKREEKLFGDAFLDAERAWSRWMCAGARRRHNRCSTKPVWRSHPNRRSPTAA